VSNELHLYRQRALVHRRLRVFLHVLLHQQNHLEMNSTNTLDTLREIRGLLRETEKHFLTERGWKICRQVGEVIFWTKQINGHEWELNTAFAIFHEERNQSESVCTKHNLQIPCDGCRLEQPPIWDKKS
jgi:hypothetical protein